MPGQVRRWGRGWRGGPGSIISVTCVIWMRSTRTVSSMVVALTSQYESVNLRSLYGCRFENADTLNVTDLVADYGSHIPKYMNVAVKSCKQNTSDRSHTHVRMVATNLVGTIIAFSNWQIFHFLKHCKVETFISAAGGDALYTITVTYMCHEHSINIHTGDHKL